MNKSRRKKIQNLIDSIQDLQTKLEEIKDEEENAYENLPESLQDGEKGTKMSDAIDNLDSAYSCLEELAGYLNEAII